MKLKYFCMAVVVLLIQDEVYSDPECKIDSKLCPKYKITGDLKNLTVLMSYQRKLVLDVWESPLIPQLSEAAKKLVDIVKLMANSDYSYFVNVAYQFSTWSIIYLPYNDGCDQMCFFGQFVNASLDWELNKDKNTSSSAVVGWKDIVPFNCHRITQTALQAIGCPPLPDLPPKNPPKCYKKGLVYNIKKAFKLFGRLLPCGYKKSSLALYNSTDYMDKLLVVLAVASFSPVQLNMFNLHPPQYIFESVALTLNLNTSRCCCQERTSRMLSLCKIHFSAAVANAATLLKNKYQYDECINFTEKH